MKTNSRLSTDGPAGVIAAPAAAGQTSIVRHGLCLLLLTITSLLTAIPSEAGVGPLSAAKGGGDAASFLYNSSNSSVSNNVTEWHGMKFTVGPFPLTVTDLGRWKISGNTGTHSVKLVLASTGADVSGGSVSIDMATASADDFAYVPLAAPITLAANTAYYLVSSETAGGDQWYGYTTVWPTNVAGVNDPVSSPTGAAPWTVGPYGSDHCTGPVNFIAMPTDQGYLKTATASSASSPASNATDGNTATAWTSANTETEWIYLNMGSEHFISGVTLNWNGSAYAQNYTIDVSDDGSTWTTVYDTIEGGGGIEKIGLGTAGHYVRMRATLGPGAGYSLNSFEVYGSTSVDTTFPMDEGFGTTTVDSSGNSLTGTLVGAPTWISGALGNALSFNGTNSVTLNNGTATGPLKPTLPVTVAAWVKLNSTSFARIFTSDQFDNVWYAGYALSVGPTVGCDYGDNGSVGPAHRRTKTGTTNLATGQWYHIAAVISGSSNMQLYVNGVNDGGTYSGSGGTMVHSTSPSKIGTGGGAYAFNGSIDDVQIYGRDLSAEEIADIAQGTEFVTDATLGGIAPSTTKSVGYKFTVGATPITVRKLGRWVITGNTGTHTVKLVLASTGADVSGGSVSIDTSIATPDSFAYAALATPLTLSANTAYYVVSSETSGGDQWHDAAGTTVAHTSAAVVNNAIWSNTGTAPWTNAYSAGASYGPVSFTYTK